jgi:heat shock protein HslJ
MRILVVAGLLIASVSVLAGCASESGGDISGPTWHLISLTTNTPQRAAPVPADARENYTITFNDDGTFNAKADCNQVAGTYTITGNAQISIAPGPTTLAACPDGSLGEAYVVALAQAATFTTTTDQLTLTLTDDGTLTFQAA